jgi:hypothetical protein
MRAVLRDTTSTSDSIDMRWCQRLIAKSGEWSGVESMFRLVPEACKHIFDSLFIFLKHLECKIDNLTLRYVTLSWYGSVDMVGKMAVESGELGGGSEVGCRSDGKGTAAGKALCTCLRRISKSNCTGNTDFRYARVARAISVICFNA